MKTSTVLLFSAALALLTACDGAPATAASEPAAAEQPATVETEPDEPAVAEATTMPHGDHDHAEAADPADHADHGDHAHEGGAMDNVLAEGDYDPADLVQQPGAAVGDITTCLVSGEVFPVTEDSPFFEHEGEPVYFCCPSCIRQFQRNPETFLGAGNGAEETGMVELVAAGTRFDPPVSKERVPNGSWICDMGTVHFAATEQGDGSCPICGMHLVEH
jgi:YHS domain-containing protein